jgi:hypothetical protein
MVKETALQLSTFLIIEVASFVEQTIWELVPLVVIQMLGQELLLILEEPLVLVLDRFKPEPMQPTFTALEPCSIGHLRMVHFLFQVVNKEDL